MICTHDISERESAIADGMCPQCLFIKIQFSDRLIMQMVGALNDAAPAVHDDGTERERRVLKALAAAKAQGFE